MQKFTFKNLKYFSVLFVPFFAMFFKHFNDSKYSHSNRTSQKSISQVNLAKRNKIELIEIKTKSNTSEITSLPKNVINNVHTTTTLFDKIEEEESKKVPQEWIDLTHKCAPGDNWNAIEGKSLMKLMMMQKKRQNKSNGNWVERGPTNVNGRITDIDIDFQQEKIYALSDHGVVFSSNLNGTNMTPLNDQFPIAIDVSGHLKHYEGTNGRLISSGWIKQTNGWGVYYSNDEGATWSPSSGCLIDQTSGIRRLAVQGNDTYLFTQEFNAPQFTDFYRIYKSTDLGATFSLLYQSAIPVGNGVRHLKSDMWLSNESSDQNLFLLLEDSLFSVNKFTGVRNLETLVSNGPLELGLLTGRSTNGIVKLNIYEGNAGIGRFYSWSSANSFVQFQGQLNDWWLSYPFGSNSFTCSAVSADTLYFGGILTSKSTDGGQTWTQIDMDPTNSYALYHGDVPKTLSIVNPNSQQEEFYLGTDGGMYKWNNTVNSFDSLGVPGLNTTQIYKMATRHQNPGTMYIGAQDNGYSHTNLGTQQTGAVDFTFQWGGDVSNVGSGDQGETFWLWWLGDGCNYMSGATSVISNWDPYQFNGSIPYWEAPIWISNHFPDRCYTAGFLNNSNGNYIIQLQANPGGVAIPTQLPTNFLSLSGAKIAALAISPLDSNYFYVATENGYFYTSTNGGLTWSNGTLLSNSMYPREIYPSKVNLGEVLVGGSGYSNAAVFRTTNHGVNFSAFNTGMLPCRVNAFAANADESLIYAATSIGPYEFDINSNEWVSIVGTNAPINNYMDVDFLETDKIARFATYARGVWDYKVDQLNTADLSTKLQLELFPNPTEKAINIQTTFDGEYHIEIFNITGKSITQQHYSEQNITIEVGDFAPGVYLAVVTQGNQTEVIEFIKK